MKKRDKPRFSRVTIVSIDSHNSCRQHVALIRHSEDDTFPKAADFLTVPRTPPPASSQRVRREGRAAVGRRDGWPRAVGIGDAGAARCARGSAECLTGAGGSPLRTARSGQGGAGRVAGAPTSEAWAVLAG